MTLCMSRRVALSVVGSSPIIRSQGSPASRGFLLLERQTACPLVVTEWVTDDARSDIGRPTHARPNDVRVRWRLDTLDAIAASAVV